MQPRASVLHPAPVSSQEEGQNATISGFSGWHWHDAVVWWGKKVGPVEIGSVDFIWNHGIHRTGHWAWKTCINSELQWEGIGPPSLALLLAAEPLTTSRTVRSKYWGEEACSSSLGWLISIPFLSRGRGFSFLVLKEIEAYVWGREAGNEWRWAIWKSTHHTQIILKIWRLFKFFNWDLIDITY